MHRVPALHPDMGNPATRFTPLPIWPPGTADGTVQESKLSVVGLDGFPLEPALPPSFLQQPAQEFEIAEWQVRGACTERSLLPHLLLLRIELLLAQHASACAASL